MYHGTTVQEILIQIDFEVAIFQARCKVGYEGRNRAHFRDGLEFDVTEISMIAGGKALRMMLWSWMQRWGIASQKEK